MNKIEKRFVVLVACLATVALAAPFSLGDLMRLHNSTAAARPAASTTNEGGLIYNTDTDHANLCGAAAYTEIASGAPTNDNVLVGNGTSYLNAALVNTPVGNALGYDTATNTFSSVSISDSVPTHVLAPFDTFDGPIMFSAALEIGQTQLSGSQTEIITEGLRGKISVAGAGGTTDATVTVDNGVDTCTFSFACNTATGPVNVGPGAGVCIFLANEALTYTVATIGDCATGPTFDQITFEAFIALN